MDEHKYFPHIYNPVREDQCTHLNVGPAWGLTSDWDLGIERSPLALYLCKKSAPSLVVITSIWAHKFNGVQSIQMDIQSIKRCTVHRMGAKVDPCEIRRGVCVVHSDELLSGPHS